MRNAAFSRYDGPFPLPVRAILITGVADMGSSRRTRIGIMGFGRIGRQIYQLASSSDDLEIAAIADIAQPRILHYLLDSDGGNDCTLEGNYLRNPAFDSRMLQNDIPGEIPWDVFGVDIVIDASGRFRSAEQLQPHINNGAPRVILPHLPDTPLDKLLVPGINEDTAAASDRLISVGSATTTAFALALSILHRAFGVEVASITSVHAYTSDQSLQDYAGSDYRRSRSAAQNIIPNSNASASWIERLLPEFAGKLSGHALNVPVQHGSLLDLSTVMASSEVTAEAVNQAMTTAASEFPGVVTTVDDPIVSSDVIGNSHSLVFDLKGTLKAGGRMIKSLAWYETLGHAHRTVDAVRRYQSIGVEGVAS